jgi:hypothetical protein
MVMVVAGGALSGGEDYLEERQHVGIRYVGV